MHHQSLPISTLHNNLVGSLLLLRLVEDVDRPPGLVGNVRNVESPRLLLANLLHLLEVALRELNLLEVFLNARCCDRLGDDRVAAHLGPGKDDLCGGSADAARNLLDGVVLNEEGKAEHVVAESLSEISRGTGGSRQTGTHRVFGNVNVLLLAVLNQLWLEEAWVALNLVSSRCDTSAVDDGLEVLLGVVGNTNCAGLFLRQLCHGLPCVDNGDVVEHLDILALHGEEVVVNIAALVKGNGEVDKVEVQVVEAELSQAVVESRWHILRAVLRVPELGCDEDILALEARHLAAKSLLESLCDFLLVAVDLGKIQVTVASLEGLEDGGTDLAGLSLPCAKTQLTDQHQSVKATSCTRASLLGYSRDGGAGVEGDLSSERHICNV